MFQQLHNKQELISKFYLLNKKGKLNRKEWTQNKNVKIFIYLITLISLKVKWIIWFLFHLFSFKIILRNMMLVENLF